MISIVHVSVVVGVVIIVIVVMVVIFVIMISIVVVGVVIAATCGFGVRGLMNDDLLLPSSFFFQQRRATHELEYAINQRSLPRLRGGSGEDPARQVGTGRGVASPPLQQCISRG